MGLGQIALGAALGVVGTLAYQRMQTTKRLAPAGQARMTDFDWGQQVAASRFGVGGAPTCDQWSRLTQAQKGQWLSDNAPVIWNGVRMSMNLNDVIRGADIVCAHRQAEAAANQLASQHAVGDAARAIEAMPDATIARILLAHGITCQKLSMSTAAQRQHLFGGLAEFQSAAGSAAMLSAVLSYVDARVMRFCLTGAAAASHRPSVIRVPAMATVR